MSRLPKLYTLPTTLTFLVGPLASDSPIPSLLIHIIGSIATKKVFLQIAHFLVDCTYQPYSLLEKITKTNKYILS